MHVTLLAAPGVEEQAAVAGAWGADHGAGLVEELEAGQGLSTSTVVALGPHECCFAATCPSPGGGSKRHWRPHYTGTLMISGLAELDYCKRRYRL